MKPNGNKVLVMEFCTEGSLYAILDQPKNYFGLEEKEFLDVLCDLSKKKDEFEIFSNLHFFIANGLLYMRKNSFIHRDLKPSNIMKTFAADGRVLYKICDFGAARELNDGDQFQSLVGTEEYLV